MVILVNYKDNYDTATTLTNKSVGFDLSTVQLNLVVKIKLNATQVEVRH